MTLNLRTLKLQHFAWFVLGLTLCVILWGAAVRATRSGDGCGHEWPLCRDQFAQGSPQTKTWIEFTHRATSGVNFLLVIVLAAWVWRARDAQVAQRTALRPAIWSVVFMTLEAAIGAGLVLLKLVGGNRSYARLLWMSAHLINTFLLLGSLALTAWCLSFETQTHRNQDSPNELRSGLLSLSGILLIGITGALNALSDTLYPPSSLMSALAQDFSANAPPLIRLRIVHPLMAALVGVLIARWVIEVLAHSYARQRTLAWMWLSLFGLQILVGACNVLTLTPVALQLLHLGLADGLWIILVLLVCERNFGRSIDAK